MGEVVLHADDLAAESLAGKGLLQVAGDRGALALVPDAVDDQPQIRPLQHGIADAAHEIGAGSAVDGDIGEVAKRGTGLLETVADSLAREASPVLDAPEPLLFGGGDDGALAHEAGGCIAVK